MPHEDDATLSSMRTALVASLALLASVALVPALLQAPAAAAAAAASSGPLDAPNVLAATRLAEYAKSRVWSTIRRQRPARPGRSPAAA